MSKGWARSALVALAMAAAAPAGAQSTFADPFAPAAGSVVQNADDAAKAAPAAGGAEAPKEAAPKPKKPRPHKDGAGVIAVVVNNKRSVGLVELTAALAGSADAKQIAGPLAANRKTVAHLKRDKACLFDLRGCYADGADIDMSSVELCKDKTINLTDE